MLNTSSALAPNNFDTPAAAADIPIISLTDAPKFLPTDVIALNTASVDEPIAFNALSPTPIYFLKDDIPLIKSVFL